MKKQSTVTAKRHIVATTTAYCYCLLRTAHCLLLTACCLLPAAAGAQTPSASSVNVRPISADYTAAPPTVTFEVSWPGNTRDADHRSKVWVLVDYRRIKDNAYTGDWSRAGISTASTPTATAGSTVTLEPGNTKGFWLQGWAGASPFAATVTVPVTVDLKDHAPQFAWCGVASDRPPTAVEYTGYYALYGTPKFIINGTITEPSKAYTDCIYSLTDSTGCPGEAPAMPEITGFTATTTTICEGESVTLTATAPGAAEYRFNNGSWTSSPSTVVTPNATTPYTLQVRSAGGCTVTSSTTVTVTVNDPPTGLSLTADPLTVCAGQTVTLTANATGADSYSLDGSTWKTDNTFTENPNVSATYTLYAKNAAGCTVSLPDAAVITVNNALTGLSLTPVPATICSGETVTLTATPAGAASYSLDGTTWQAANTFTVHPTTTTTYDLYVQSAAGCAGTLTDAATVTVQQPSTAPTTLTASTATVCSGIPVTLTASGGALSTAASYQFGTGNETLTSTTATTYTLSSVTATATYWVKVVTTSACAAPSGSPTCDITVHDLPTITLASGSSAQTVTYGAAMTSIKYNTANASSATVAGLPSGVSGAWASNVYTISGTPTSHGTSSYTVTTTNDNGCTNAKATGNITVPLPAGCVPKTLNLGTVGRTNSNTYTRNGITVAAPVTATYCDKATYAGGSSGVYQVDCRNNTNNDYGHLFSWCMVVQYADKLCPSPWRVPSRNDFCYYAEKGNECTGYSDDIKSGMEGWLLGGCSEPDGVLAHTGSIGLYWSATAQNSTDAYNPYLYSTGYILPGNYGKGYGLSLRCVR
jgi:hypothetical protein